VGAERADQVGLRPTAHAGDLGAERSRDLHREGPDPSAGTEHEHLLARLDLRDVPDGPQGGEPGDRHRGRLLEAQPCRLPNQLVRPTDCELGERALDDAHHLVTDAKAGCVRADGLDDAGDVPPPHAGAHLVEGGHQPHEVR